MRRGTYVGERWKNWLCAAVGGAALMLAVGPLAAEDRDTRVRNDLDDVNARGDWIYNDLERGLAEAQRTGKPLLVVFRCIP